MQLPQKPADSVVVLDFETTGLSPDQGDRVIEVGAVRIENGEITQRFQQLMDPGMRVNSFIELYTGITNAMLGGAPSCSAGIEAFVAFLGDSNIVAHNASFDRRFLDAEIKRTRQHYCGEFACSMLVARRVYVDAPNHKLATLVEYQNITSDGTFHRALADSEMTARLWLKLLADLERCYGIRAPSFGLMQKLARTSKSAAPHLLRQQMTPSGAMA